MNVWMGIDPGKTGCACFLFEDRTADFLDWPKTDVCVDVYRPFRSILMGHNPMMAAVERVHAMPGQGVKSVFTFGKNLGRWEMLLAILRIPYQDPTPHQWQKGVVRKADSDNPKIRSYQAAIRLYPHLTDYLKGPRGGILDGRCDSLLLAHYIMEKTNESNTG